MSYLTIIAIIVLSMIVAGIAEFKRQTRKNAARPSPTQGMNLPPSSQAAFIVCTFSMLAKLAAADGRVSEEEMHRVEQYIENDLRLDTKTKGTAMSVFRDAANSPLELRDYAEKFQSSFPDSVHRIDQVVEILLEVSAADGQLTSREEKLIRSAALLLGMSEPAFERIKSRYVRSGLLQ